MPNKTIRNRITLLTICLLFPLLTGACSANKKPVPKENLPAPQAPVNGSRDSYNIQLALDTDAKEISGNVRISLTNTSEDTWTQLCFRDYISAIGTTFDEMSGSDSSLVSEFTSIVEVSTNESLDYSRADGDTSILFVNLNDPLESGESTVIQFDYTASIPENAFRYRYTAVDGGENLLFELANFYPVLSMYEDGEWQNGTFYYEGECFYSKCADYSITLSLPEEYTVVSSGTEQKGTSNNGLCTWTIEADNMRDVGITACNYFAFTESNFEDIQVRCYYFDNESAKKQADLMMDTAINSMKFNTQNIGGYPYSNLDVVMTDDMVGAIEFPTYVRIGDYSSQIDSDDSDYIMNLITENTSHEVAHQWFYAVVGNNCYQEPWLDESFASFCQLAYQSEQLSQKESKKFINESRLAVQDNNGIFLNLPYDKLGGNYLNTVYGKGKFFLYDLMNAMGEDDFYKMLQEYYSTYAFREVHTKDFVDIVYRYTDKDSVKKLIEANLE